MTETMETKYKWYSMETAPKDGTIVGLSYPNYMEGCNEFVDAHWNGEHWICEKHGLKTFPTHFRHLNPPENKNES